MPTMQHELRTTTEVTLGTSCGRPEGKLNAFQPFFSGKVAFLALVTMQLLCSCYGNHAGSILAL